MKKIILIVTLFCLPKLMAQQNSIASGGNATGSNGSSAYTIGQVAYINATGSNGSVSQGIEQPFEIITLGVDNFPSIVLTMKVYPNPTTSLVYLKIENYDSDQLQYQLLDLNGREIDRQNITQPETKIEMNQLSSAIYFLKVSDESKLLKIFKIIKNN